MSWLETIQGALDAKEGDKAPDYFGPSIWDLPDAPVEFVTLRGLLAKGFVTMLCGKPSSGKSLFAALVALAVNGGFSVFGEGKKAVEGGFSEWNEKEGKKGKVAFFDWDSGPRSLSSNLRTLARGNDYDPKEIVSIDARPPLFGLCDTHAEAALMQACEGKDLVVIDSFSPALRGEVDENDAAIGAFVGLLARVAEKTGAAVALIHHDRKAAGEGTDKVRGSIAITAAAHQVWGFERNSGDDDNFTVTVTMTKEPKFPVPYEWRAYRKPFSFSVTDDALNGRKVKLMHAEDFAEKAHEAEGQMEAAVRAKVLGVLTAEPLAINHCDLAKLVCSRKGPLGIALRDMLAEGLIVRKEKPSQLWLTAKGLTEKESAGTGWAGVIPHAAGTLRRVWGSTPCVIPHAPSGATGSGGSHGSGNHPEPWEPGTTVPVGDASASQGTVVPVVPVVPDPKGNQKTSANSFKHGDDEKQAGLPSGHDETVNDGSRAPFLVSTKEKTAVYDAQAHPDTASQARAAPDQLLPDLVDTQAERTPDSRATMPGNCPNCGKRHGPDRGCDGSIVKRRRATNGGSEPAVHWVYPRSLFGGAE
jgi:hypothetical protein